MGWTCDAAHTVCTLDAAALDFATNLLQGVFSVFGALCGLGILTAVSVVWKRL